MKPTVRLRLRILLSAYACEPGKGSEPGVGWNWALTLARRGHSVWVLTRSNNRGTIEPEQRRLDLEVQARLRFIYYDPPRWLGGWKKGGRGVRLYYLLWQWGAYRVARREHERLAFDRVHHVTFASVRQPSFMGRLGIPFIFGPVGGGEHAPWRLRTGFGWKGSLTDAVRDLANALVRIDPLMHATFSRAESIHVTSEQTRELVPLRYQSKTHVRLAIGIEGQPPASTQEKNRGTSQRILYAGRLIYWKGMHIGLAAFAGLLRKFPEARLSIVGSGPEEARLRQLARNLGIDRSIDWTAWVSQSELADAYQSHDVLLFPSLHDSGGMVVLEAMQRGLPIICLKLGGPGVLVDETCGIALDTGRLDEPALVRQITAALAGFFAAPTLQMQLSQGARARVEAFTWHDLAAGIYEPFEHATILPERENLEARQAHSVH